LSVFIEVLPSLLLDYNYGAPGQEEEQEERESRERPSRSLK
jgi:hypothetical protein